MNLIEFIILIGQRLLSSAPLPGGAFTNPEFGVDIASDWATLKPAKDYWRARLAALQGGGTFDFSPQPDWLAFTVQASSVNYAPWVAQRNVIRSANEYNAIVTSSDMRGRILPDLDALIAASEIATFIGQSDTFGIDLTQSQMQGELAAGFNATAAPAAGSDDARVIGRGLRAARELHDAGQRFQFARAHVGLLSTPISFTEALALHRAEGAFCMPPPLNSLKLAPLILTAETPAARTENAFLNLGGRSFSRPGYLPSIGGAVPNNETRDLLGLLANALTLGGLDNIVSWPVSFDNANDELALLVNAAVAANVGGLGTLESSWAERLAPADRPVWLQVAQGIAMAHIEADSSLTGDALIANVVADLGVMRTFSSLTTPALGLSIIDDDDRTNTGKYLELTTRWYASRTRPETLLARRDRDAFPAMDRLTPYMSYLRFHSGDVIFAGLLLRTAQELPALQTQWKAAIGRASFATAIGSMPDADFGASLDASFFSVMTAAEKSAVASALALWRNNANARYVQGKGESVWRHVGLLANITAPWKPASPGATDTDTKRMTALADAMLSAMTAITNNALIKPISLALEYMPLSRLFGIASFDEKNWAANLRKAENFERLRLFIDAARGLASMDDKGNRP
jgi:hypothetical protein